MSAGELRLIGKPGANMQKMPSYGAGEERHILRNAQTAFFVFLLTVFCVSCRPGIRIDTSEVQDFEFTGAFRVIFFGCNFNNDIETIAFLDREEDQYTIEPDAPDLKYLVRKEVEAGEAVMEARKFVNCSSAFRVARLNRIIGPENVILGYEVRPLYDSTWNEADIVLHTDYEVEGDKVIVAIRQNRLSK